MARAELERSWIAPGDPRSLEETLREILEHHQFRLTEEDNDELVATQGSQLLTRLLGGWFVPPKWLPQRVTIRWRRTADGVRIRVYFEETLGFGIMDSILAQKYEKHFAQLANEMRTATGGRKQNQSEDDDE